MRDGAGDFLDLVARDHQDGHDRQEAHADADALCDAGDEAEGLSPGHCSLPPTDR
jgi:hypothetical protein